MTIIISWVSRNKGWRPVLITVCLLQQQRFPENLKEGVPVLSPSHSSRPGVQDFLVFGLAWALVAKMNFAGSCGDSG